MVLPDTAAVGACPGLVLPANGSESRPTTAQQRRAAGGRKISRLSDISAKCLSSSILTALRDLGLPNSLAFNQLTCLGTISNVPGAFPPCSELLGALWLSSPSLSHICQTKLYQPFSRMLSCFSRVGLLVTPRGRRPRDPGLTRGEHQGPVHRLF